MSGRLRLPFRLPLAASLVGHAGALVALALLVGRLPPALLPIPVAKSIEVMLPPPQPIAAARPPIPEPPPVVQPEPPPQPPPVVKREPPPPPVVKAEPPPPPPHPKSKPVVVRRPPPVREPPPEPPPMPYRPPVQMVAPLAPPSPPTQTAAIPRPMPPPPPAAGPVVSAGYRAALGAWLESHKRYPESARERGETGQAVLRFHVERSGRLLDFAVVRGTGYPDLDAAIDQMMRGASLPPFPGDMTAGDIEVSVTIRFALTR